jgi:hypothetical protein
MVPPRSVQSLTPSETDPIQPAAPQLKPKALGLRRFFAALGSNTIASDESNFRIQRRRLGRLCSRAGVTGIFVAGPGSQTPATAEVERGNGFWQAL